MVKSLPSGKELNFIVWHEIKIGSFPCLDLSKLTWGFISLLASTNKICSSFFESFDRICFIRDS